VHGLLAVQAGGGEMSDMKERIKAAIAEKFAPAIDFQTPYAKVMLDMAADAIIEMIYSQIREALK
jgi:hypothetical protein